MSELIGRDNEIGLIKSYINKMKSFHIYGPEGAGKTAILEHIHNNWNELHTPLIPIFCRTSTKLREILIRVAGFLLYRSGSLQNTDKFKKIKQIWRRSDLKTLNSRDLKNIIFRNIGNKKFCIILDHLERVTPKINTFLTPLKDIAMTITASRQSWDIADCLFSARLDYCLWLLPKVQIKNLLRHDAFLLMKHTFGDAIRVNDNLFEEAYRITRGNPGLTKEILAKALMPEYRIDGYINLRLIMLDLDIEKVKEVKI